MAEPLKKLTPNKTVIHADGTQSYEIAAVDRSHLVTDLRYRMNDNLRYQLDIMANAVRFDFDSILLVDGDIEGSGKSSLAQQMAYYCAWKSGRKFTIDHIVFTPEQFQAAVMEADKFQAIVWDEAYMGTSKFRQSSGINQAVTSLLQQIRQRNLFIFIVLPYFFDLNPYLAVPRSWFLIHVYLNTQKAMLERLAASAGKDSTREELERRRKAGEVQTELDFSKPVFFRGFFEFYSRTRKKGLYLTSKREYDYDKVPANFRGTFPRFYTVDESAYKAKKAAITTGTDLMPDRIFVEECLKRRVPVRFLTYWTSLNDTSIFNVRDKMIELGRIQYDAEQDEINALEMVLKGRFKTAGGKEYLAQELNRRYRQRGSKYVRPPPHD